MTEKLQKVKAKKASVPSSPHDIESNSHLSKLTKSTNYVFKTWSSDFKILNFFINVWMNELLISHTLKFVTLSLKCYMVYL